MGVRIAVRGQPLQRRAARVAQAEQPRTLLEGLTGRVIERPADDVEVGPVIVDLGQQRVAAGGEQQQERRLQRLRLEVQRGHVPV